MLGGMLRAERGRALALALALAAPLSALGSCGGGSHGAPGGQPTTLGTGAGGSTGVVLTGTGGGTVTATCGGPDAGDAADDGWTNCEGLEGGVSFSASLAPLFAGCASETCHCAPWTQPILVDVPAYECCDGLPLVTPGNANRSYIFDKIEGIPRCIPTRMPLNGPPYLSDADILLVRRWICEGAPDN